MKLAICKGGTNVTFSNNNGSAANADIQYLLRQLDISKHDVTIVTHKTRNTVIPKRLRFQEIQETEDFDNFDKILLFNFSINFFGGAEDPNLIQLYRALARTRTEIVYINTDGQLPFRQLWPSIWKRDWAKDYVEEEFHITSDKVRYLTQGYNIPKVRKQIAKKRDSITPHAIDYYNIPRTVLAKHELYIKDAKHKWHERPYDLAFGGYVRNSHKRKKIEKFYNQPNTLLFGNLRDTRAPLATFERKVSYQSFIRKMQTAKATIIIGDKDYNNNFFTLRMYESLLADCITYIDQELDPYRRFYGQNSEHMYITNNSEMLVPYENWRLIRNEVLESYDYEFERQALTEAIQG